MPLSNGFTRSAPSADAACGYDRDRPRHHLPPHRTAARVRNGRHGKNAADDVHPADDAAEGGEALLSLGLEGLASIDGLAPTVMKKLLRAVPGAVRAIEIVPSTWRSPVRVVGSCAMGGSWKTKGRRLPPWTKPRLAALRVRAAR